MVLMIVIVAACFVECVCAVVTHARAGARTVQDFTALQPFCKACAAVIGEGARMGAWKVELSGGLGRGLPNGRPHLP